MRDRDHARNAILKYELPALEEFFGERLELNDELTESHEWGWLFDLSICDSGNSDSRHFQILVDRMTGASQQVLSSGLKGSLFALTQTRERLLEANEDHWIPVDTDDQ